MIEQPLWQTVPTAGLTMAERAWLKDSAAWIARIFKEPLMVNIGVFRGASVHCLRSGAPEAMLVGIDKEPICIVQHLDVLDMEYIQARSHDCHTEFDQAIHFLFLDSGTRYEMVRQDLIDWTPKVAERGLFAILCYTRPAPRWGVKQAVGEWLDNQPQGKWQEVKAPDTLKAFQRSSDG